MPPACHVWIVTDDMPAFLLPVTKTVRVRWSVLPFNAGVVDIAVTLFVWLGSQSLGAQTPFQYRGYVLGSSLASVIETSGTDLVVGQWSVYLHPPGRGANWPPDLPGAIQQLEWRAPYVRSGRGLPDPVQDVLFSFYKDRLYRVVVTYDPDRTEGLTDDEVIASIAAIYGAPVADCQIIAQPSPATDEDVAPTVVVAQWTDETSVLTLTRATSARQFQLVLILKILPTGTSAVITQGLRLDTREGTERQLADRQRELAKARAAGRTHALNKAAFRP